VGPRSRASSLRSLSLGRDDSVRSYVADLSPEKRIAPAHRAEAIPRQNGSSFGGMGRATWRPV